MKQKSVANLILAAVVAAAGLAFASPDMAKAGTAAAPSKRELRAQRRAERQQSWRMQEQAAQRRVPPPYVRPYYDPYPLVGVGTWWGPTYGPIWKPFPDPLDDPYFRPGGWD